jgi:hypothetical protein
MMHGGLTMRRRLQAMAGVMVMMSSVGWAAKKPDPADFKIKVHVSSVRYSEAAASTEILTVDIGGKHYELSGWAANGLLNPGDYMAKLSTDWHRTSFESQQYYQFLMPDGTTREFQVTMQAE